MIDALQQAMYGYTEHPEYQTLPDSIKSLHSAKEYAWLGTERDRLVERETQPDMDYTE
jgi:hypothetical protein